MTFTDRRLVETYSSLFEGLNTQSRRELLESLAKSLQTEHNIVENNFYKSFGAFSSEKSAETIIEDIKSSRTFRNKEIKL